MLSNIWVNIALDNGLAPNDTVPLTDPTLILLINDAQGTNLYILMAIRIITANALEIIFQYDNHFFQGTMSLCVWLNGRFHVGVS